MSLKLEVELTNGKRGGKSSVFDVLRTTKLVIGTDPDSDFVISGSEFPMVARRHMTISVNSESKGAEAKCTSVSGLYHNGNKIHQQAFSDSIELELGESGPLLNLRLRDQSATAVTSGSSDVAKGAEVHSKKKGILVGTIGVTLLLIIFSWIIYDRGAEQQRVDEKVAAAQMEAEGRLAKTFGSLEYDLTRTKSELARKQERLAASLTEVERAAEEARNAATQISSYQSDSDRFVDAARQYEKAVVLVSSGATAFAIEPRVLATNAHVAIMNPSHVYLNRGKGKRLNVVRSVTHPKYDKDDETPGGRFDVGLLYLDEDMPAVFNVAKVEELMKVDSGYPVCYIGFPAENLRGGGVNTSSPVATMKTGVVTSVSDFWLNDTSFPKRKLIRHNLGTAGGASGSPVFNRRGEVIAIHNAGNYVGKIEGKRIQSGVGISFAQRIDCLDGIWRK